LELNLTKKRHGYLWLFSIAAIVVILDQLSKAWIHQRLPLGMVYHPDAQLSLVIRLVHAKNTGAALGLFQNLGAVFTIIPLIIGVLILYYYPRVAPEDWLIRLSMALYLGGGIGNMIDRLVYGYVTDFLSVGNFPIINFADICISAGAVLFILGILWHGKSQPAAQSQPDTEDSAAQEPFQPQ
jgi:signal peptidase II